MEKHLGNPLTDEKLKAGMVYEDFSRLRNDDNFRWKIITSYGKLLENNRLCFLDIRNESDLSFPKELIRLSIANELLWEMNEDVRNYLEYGFVELESFLPPKEWQPVEPLAQAFEKVREILGTDKELGPEEFIELSKRMHENPQPFGELIEILANAGDQAFTNVRASWEKIFERKREREYQCQALRMISGKKEEKLKSAIAKIDNEWADRMEEILRGIQRKSRDSERRP